MIGISANSCVILHLTGGYVATLRSAQISQGETSHIPGPLCLMLDP